MIQNLSQAELQKLLNLYQNRQYDEAEKLATSIIEKSPDHIWGWKILGAVLGETGRISEALSANQKASRLDATDAILHCNIGAAMKDLGRQIEAEASFKKALAIEPSFVEAHSNLAGTLLKLGRPEEAEESYRQVIALKPNYAEGHSNLAAMLQGLGKLEEAEASYRQAIKLEPDDANVYNNLGVTLKDLGKFEEAKISFRQAITLKPDLAEAHGNMGVTLGELGRLEEAEASFMQAIALKPDFSEAKHCLAALRGRTTKSAPRAYVEKMFDGYAPKFDHSLVDKLDYRMPKMISDVILENHSEGMLGSILDLGCGTGLAGREIREHCSYLEGVDLSNSMLEEAREKNIYDKLRHCDIVDFLSTEDLNFDYFISTDVFVYVGDLSDVFRLIKSRNRSGGKLVFSTENTHQKEFFLERSGRYSHSRAYIESLCEKFSYRLSHFEIKKLRKEKGVFISGGLYLLDF